jgi:hypothetical protein
MLTVGWGHFGPAFDLSISYSSGAQKEQEPSGDDEVFIYQIVPDRKGDKVYRLAYRVKALKIAAGAREMLRIVYGHPLSKPAWETHIKRT